MADRELPRGAAEAVEYIGTLANQLAYLARAHNLDILAYLCQMVALQAANEKTVDHEGSSGLKSA